MFLGQKNPSINFHPFEKKRAEESKSKSKSKEVNTMVGLSAAERVYIEDGIAQDLRLDGRGRQHFRSLSIQTGVIPQANGSARVRLAGTDVIASVKAELGSPQPGRPGCGNMFISVECSPTAAPEFEGKGGEETNLELAKALQRNFLGGASGAGAAIDLTTLIVIEGKVCWELYIDGLVLSSDGNILDALSIAVKAALSNTGIPKVQVMGGLSLEEADFELSDNPEEFSHLDTAQVPVTVTISKVGRYHIVDATAEEESQVSSAVSVAVNSKGLICGLTKSGTAGLDPSILMDMISVGKRVGLKTISSVETDIAAAERTLEAE